MTGTSNMNIVLGQGNAVKEVHNVKNSHLEMNQQFVAQKAEEQRKEDRSKIKAFDKGNRVELKADEETRDIPIILLTAVGEAVPTTTYTHADGMSTEADDYIAKPIDTESLWKAVSDLF